MNLWLINHYFKSLRRSPKLQGPQLYLTIFLVIFGIFYLALLAYIVDTNLEPFISDPNQRVLAVLLGLFVSDLLLRLLFSKQSYASYCYFTLPISKVEYSLQTLILSHFNIFNVISFLFLAFYWSNNQLIPELSTKYLSFICLLILSNNYLNLILKRYKYALLAVLIFIGLPILIFQIELLGYVAGFLSSFAYFGWFYLSLVLLVSFMSVYLFYHREPYEDKKALFANIKLNIRLEEPLIWQEVLLILRNKRPRGVI